MINIKPIIFILLALLTGLFFIHVFFINPDIYLWKIESQEKTIYLLGTIHVFKPELYSEIDKKIIKAFDQSDIILFEKKYCTKTGRSIEEESLYCFGDSLENHIPENYYNELKNTLKDNNIDINDYCQYRPGYFVNKIFYLSRIKYDWDELWQNGIEWYLWFRMTERNYNTQYDGLEYADYYFGLLEEEMSETDMGYYLASKARGYLNESLDIIEGYERLIDSWLNGNLEQYITDVLEQDMPNPDNEIHNNVSEKLKMIHHLRNLEMANTIQDYIINQEHKTIFAMAGISHLIGKGSIIDILQKRGYKVKRIKKSTSLPFIY